MWVVIAICWLALADSGSTHHSTGAFYERDVQIEIEGTVNSVSWRNPHVGLSILVDNDDGEVREWKLEGGALNSLRRRGFVPESIGVGDRVRAAGRRATQGRAAIFLSSIFLPDGQEIPFSDILESQRLESLRQIEERQSANATSSATARAAPQDVEAANPRDGIFKVWSFGQSYRLRAPRVLRPVAQAARESWNATTDDPSLRCEEPGMPNAILNPYPIEFVDEGDRIVLKIEEWDAVRTIELSTSEADEEVPPSRLGHSRGRWEGGVLVVETSRINAPYLDGSGTPQSEDVHMVERFSLSEDETRLDYEIIVTDQQNLLEPAVWEGAWAWEPEAQVMPFECTLP